jgi:hypothetical protein
MKKVLQVALLLGSALNLYLQGASGALYPTIITETVNPWGTPQERHRGYTTWDVNLGGPSGYVGPESGSRAVSSPTGRKTLIHVYKYNEIEPQETDTVNYTRQLEGTTRGGYDFYGEAEAAVGYSTIVNWGLYEADSPPYEVYWTDQTAGFVYFNPEATKVLTKHSSGDPEPSPACS